jgi:diguanylate cyclase (GGDEF)-like protein
MLDDALRREVARVRRTGEPLSVVLLDLDRFESFAALNGEAAGDQLLRAAAEAWTSLVRASDLVARCGPSAFAVVLPGAPLQPAAALSERLRCVMPEDATASAGVAQLQPGEDAPALLSRAAAALRAAKAAGLDRVSVA